MGPNKYVHLTFAISALLLAFLLALTGDWIWGYFAKPNDTILNVGAVVVALVVGVLAYRNERTRGLVTEVIRELEKVTWPTRKETYAATVVVIVTVTIASLILSVFDAGWSALTGWFLS